MIGPRVRVKFIGTAWANGDPFVRLEFEPEPDPAGREKFWGDCDKRTSIMLLGVNPAAVETMEAGKVYDVIFSPVAESK